MEADQKNVVGEQHEAGESVCELAVSEGVVSEVTDIFDLGVLHDELVHGYGGDPEKHSGDDHGDDSRNPAKDRERPRLSHNGQADLVTGEQPRCLLPGHGPELDIMSMI